MHKKSESQSHCDSHVVIMKLNETEMQCARWHKEIFNVKKKKQKRKTILV